MILVFPTTNLRTHWIYFHLVKGDVVPVLNWLSNVPWRRGGTAPPFLTWELDGVEWSASRPGHFNSGEILPGTHWILGLVGPRSGLNAVMYRKFLPRRNSNAGRPARRPSLFRLLYSYGTGTSGPVSKLKSRTAEERDSHVRARIEFCGINTREV
jgi:hypothetical protein